MKLLQGDSVPRDHSLVECESEFRAIPLDEFSDRMIIGSLGTGRCQAVQYCRFGLCKVGELENRFRCSFALCLAACHGYGLQLPCGKQHDADRHLGLSHPSAFMRTNEERLWSLWHVR